MLNKGTFALHHHARLCIRSGDLCKDPSRFYYPKTIVDKVSAFTPRKYFDRSQHTTQHTP